MATDVQIQQVVQAISFTQIIEKQIELNDSIISNWRDQNWELAIITECAEAIDSCHWKWWKAGTDDINNLKIEAIDLLHFIISNMLSWDLAYSGDTQLLSSDLANEFLQAADSQSNEMVIRSLSFTDVIKEIIRDTLEKRHKLAAHWLFILFAKLDMNFDDVSAMYFAKNLLNEYRQLRGYKDSNGNYPKVVNGIEDNVRFLAIVKEIGADDPDLREKAFAKMDAMSC
jgi:dimeric dUTPase (all-alpha-NTP-PPase superfamily)